jgi:alkylation response protein AidB-like acyl-CoA dehydrogenase
VADVAIAGALLVDCGAAWFYVPRAGTDWGVEARRSLDPTRPLHTVSLSGAECIKVVSGAGADRLRRAATVLACAEAVGGIERTVEMSVEYCKVRTQFDRPIGSFQAVKHRCADMAVRAEVARSATIYATICARDDTEDADHHASVAKWLCAEAYLQNAADNIQNHGGMGFTWECDAHLYLKRAHGFDSSFGSRMAHLDRLVAELRA